MDDVTIENAGDTTLQVHDISKCDLRRVLACGSAAGMVQDESSCSKEKIDFETTCK